VAIGSVLLVVLLITLTPSGDRPPLPVSLVVGQGRRWLADGILNLWLFVPVGLALAWRIRSPVRAIVFGFLFSTAIEVAQIWIPGRDPSLGDVIFNTAGTVLGAFLGLRPRLWLAPRASTSAGLTLVGVAAAAAVMTISAVLLRPASPFVVDRVGNDLMLHYRSRGDAMGLDQPVYWLPNAFSGEAKPKAASISVTRRRSRWDVIVGGIQATLGPTVGDGWTLLGYPDAIARKWAAQLATLWMILVCLPIGFWARSRGAFGAAALIVLALWLVPVVIGILPTPLTQWIGAALGVSAGISLARLSRRVFHDRGEAFLSELRR
jgi:hypothetical protein